MAKNLEEIKKSGKIIKILNKLPDAEVASIAKRLSQKGINLQKDQALHILDGHSPHRIIPKGNTAFPKDWTEEEILTAAKKVADNPEKVIPNTDGRAGTIRFGGIGASKIKIKVVEEEAGQELERGIVTAYPEL